MTKKRKPNVASLPPHKLWQYLMDPRKLTTPASIDDNLAEFIATLQPTGEAVFIPALPEPWTRALCCDKNVEHQITLANGSALFGYRIWYHKPYYAEAERHCVWKSAEGSLRDLSFYPDGETRCLFVPRDTLATVTESVYEKPYKGFFPFVQKLVTQVHSFNKRIGLLDGVKRVETWDDWKKMQSYEQFLRGENPPPSLERVLKPLVDQARPFGF